MQDSGNRTRAVISLLLSLVAALSFGCAGQRARYTTSVVEYLYPEKKDPVATPGVPVLSLPMRVGIAFIPGGTGGQHGGGMFQGQHAGYSLTEKKKTELMQQVAEHFKGRDFIKAIEVIPSAHLSPKGGFEYLDQVRSLYGVDSVTLLSYDQTQFTDEGFLSLTYWTFAGAYVVPGEKNDTHTMVDAVVVHIPSRKMLFRAPGISHIKGTSTPVNLSEQLRADSDQGFNQAVGQMVTNLDEQLVLFQERVKSAPGEYQVVRQGETKGGGALDVLTTLLLALLVAGGWWWSRRKV